MQKIMLVVVTMLLSITGTAMADDVDFSLDNVTATNGTVAMHLSDWFANVPNGIGNAAAYSIGTSGATVPLLSTANTWTLNQTFSALTLPPSTTGTATQTFTNSPCTGTTVAKWIQVTITGQTGTFYIPACQ